MSTPAPVVVETPVERRVLAAMTLLGGAVVPLEIALVRIFSFSIWHHFAFMVLSIALLGFALSGVLLRITPELGTPPRERASFFALAFAGTSVLAVYGACHTRFDPTFIPGHPWEAFPLLIYYFVLVIPFTFAGLAVVTLLEANARSAGTLYGFDLAGAGTTAVLAPWVLSGVGAEGLVLSASVLATVAAVLLLWHRSVGVRAMAVLACVASVAAVPYSAEIIDVRPGPGKMLGILLVYDRDHVRLVSSEWNAVGRVDVLEGAPASSWVNLERGERETDIVIDGDAATPVLPLEGGLETFTYLDGIPSTTALQAFSPRSVLVIGSGGGVDVAAAIHHGAAHVDAVEVNPIIVRLVTGPYAERLGGLFTRPDVTLHNAEGRSFVRNSDERYDLIQISLVDTWAAASSGAYSLAESYLYTTEAFEDYLAHLGDDGAFTITRWLTTPPREPLRLCSVSVEALRRMGAERPADHIAIVSHGTLATLIVRRAPFDAAAIASLERVASARGLEVLYAPGRPSAHPLAEFLTARDPEAYLRDSPFDVAPVTDDSPFFFQFGRWRDASPFGRGWRESQSSLSGRLVLITVLLQALFFSFVLIVIPSFRSIGGVAVPRGTTRVLAYFGLLGVAFMLLEVVLMQRFTLFLGHPLYALAFVLATLLVSAGAGSLHGRRFARATPGRLFVAIALACAFLALGLPLLFDVALGAPLVLRFVLSALVLAPVGFALGIPMPLAIERLAAHRQDRLVGWAWAANGVGSVIGPILAALLAIDLGFTAVLLLAGLAYLAAYAALGPWWRDAPLLASETTPAAPVASPPAHE